MEIFKMSKSQKEVDSAVQRWSDYVFENIQKETENKKNVISFGLRGFGLELIDILDKKTLNGESGNE